MGSNCTLFIVMGVAGLCFVLHIVVTLKSNSDSAKVLCCIGASIWCVVYIGWLIYGSTIVYEMHSSSSQCSASVKANTATLLSKLTLLNNYSNTLNY